MMSFSLRSLLNVRLVLAAAGTFVAVAPRSATQQNFVRHLTTTPAARMSDGGKKLFDDSELKQRLSEMEYAVTQLKNTEPPFTGKYLENKQQGTYSCVVCGATLFSSHHKFESGCGWPAFSEVLATAAVNLVLDNSHGIKRTEVTCRRCDAHLGHVFDDGPPPTHTRYCINSAAMSFTPAQ